MGGANIGNFQAVSGIASALLVAWHGMTIDGL